MIQFDVMNWKRMLAYVTGSVDEELLARSEYLVTENRILRGQIKGRIRLTDPERISLASAANDWAGERWKRCHRSQRGAFAALSRLHDQLATVIFQPGCFYNGSDGKESLAWRASSGLVSIEPFFCSFLRSSGRTPKRTPKGWFWMVNA